MKTSAPSGVTARTNADTGISSIALCAARKPVGTVAGSTCVTWFAIAAPAAARATAATTTASAHLLISLHLLLRPPRRPSARAGAACGRRHMRLRQRMPLAGLLRRRTPTPQERDPRSSRRGAERRWSPRAGRVLPVPPGGASAPRPRPGRAPPPSPRPLPSLRVSGVDARSGDPSRSSGSSLDFQLGDPRSELGPVSHADLLEQVGDVALDRLSRQEELLGDLRIARARCNQPGDRALAFGQQLAAWPAPPCADAERPQPLLRELLLRAGTDCARSLRRSREDVFGARAIRFS